MGWKTITGTILIAMGFALDPVWVTPTGVVFAAMCKALGAALGGYGLRSAIAKGNASKNNANFFSSAQQQSTGGGQ